VFNLKQTPLKKKKKKKRKKEKKKKSTRIVDSSFGGRINNGCQILFLVIGSLIYKIRRFWCGERF
jgi:hypothetical protein